MSHVVDVSVSQSSSIAGKPASASLPPNQPASGAVASSEGAAIDFPPELLDPTLAENRLAHRHCSSGE